MQQTVLKPSQQNMVQEVTKIGLVAGLYVAITLMLSVISFSALQLRLSEMFNYLALFHKRYVVAVTLGVVVANFMSPTWVLDVPIGGVSTLIVLIICRNVTKQMKNDTMKMVVTALIFAASMFTVAGQLTLLLGFPFWPTYASVAIGELFSMTVGGVIIHTLSKKINFKK